MQIFLDTANLREVREVAQLGVVTGVTTNPSLMAKERGADFKETILEICSLIDGPISAEVTGLTASEMVREAEEYAKWAPNVMVKLPITAAGLQATKALSQRGIKTNLTLCFSANQALLAALAGATFVSPFVGRLDDVGHDGMQVVRDAVTIFERYRFSTHVLAASIRHPLHVLEAAKAGAYAATVPYKVLMQLIEHPLTTVGLERFLADWRSWESRVVARTG
ncbi:MAG: fructose-6-phosphate aldolase [Chloroflexi bacterium]|nr:fructose-6-phosphate aldolase [Chloroflexota bacterium]